jgi:hypothetical protein
MASGNGDSSYMPLKCEYPDDDDDEVPDEDDFIAPVEYIDPVSAMIAIFAFKNSGYFLILKTFFEIYNKGITCTSIL